MVRPPTGPPFHYSTIPIFPCSLFSAFSALSAFKNTA